MVRSTANRDNTYTGWVTSTNSSGYYWLIKLASDYGYGTAVWRCAYLSPKTGYRYREYYVKWNWSVMAAWYKTWRLNERHYGAPRGQNKDVTRQEYGKAQVQRGGGALYGAAVVDTSWTRPWSTLPSTVPPSNLGRKRRWLTTASCLVDRWLHRAVRQPKPTRGGAW